MNLTELKQNKKGFYKCIVFKKIAKKGYKFNTIPDPLNEKYDFEIMQVTKEKFSAVKNNDCVYVWCQYIGDKKN